MVTGVEPLSLDDAKAQLKVTWESEDDLINDAISAARAYCEDSLGKALIAQTRIAYFDSFNYSGDCRMSFFGPAASVQSVTYRDENGDDQTLTVDVDYRLGSDLVATISPIEPWPAITPGPECVRIAYTCDPGHIGASEKAAIRLRLSRLYAQREDPTDEKRTLSENLLGITRIRQF